MTMPKFEPVATAMVNQHGTRWIHWKADLAHGTNLHSADQLTEAYEAGKQDQAAELEAARAEIARLKTVPMKYRRMAFNAQLQDENAKLNQQLAAEQAKNVGLRELVEHFALIDLGRSLLPDDFGLWVLRARKAIATPSDTSELEAIVKKAGEVMRERIEQWQISQGWKCREDMEPESIHALPAVILEDLK